MKTRHQIIAENTRLKEELDRAYEQIRFLQGSVHERNLRAEKAERNEKASKACFEALRKLYVEGS